MSYINIFIVIAIFNRVDVATKSITLDIDKKSIENEHTSYMYSRLFTKIMILCKNS